ncbi:MAG: hypothetical protein U9R16_03450 [Campylobacterota bacterium]|nr:hypothetical protein [Campylobacterota bacterium]
MQNEPSMDQIEDYNGNESKEKRNIVRLVILFCIVVGIGYAIAKYNYTNDEEYVGTPEKPGLNTTRNY